MASLSALLNANAAVIRQRTARLAKANGTADPVLDALRRQRADMIRKAWSTRDRSALAKLDAADLDTIPPRDREQAGTLTALGMIRKARRGT
jgi:hypothetical protein